MTFRTFTLDLTNRVAEIEQRQEEISQEIEELENELGELVAESSADSPSELDEYDEFNQQFQDLQNERKSLKGEKRSFMDAVVHWETDVDVTSNPTHEEVAEAYADVDSCVFRAEELSFGQIQAVQDDMVEKSFEMDMERQDIDGTPKQGYMQIELLREAIIDWPEEAPARTVEYGNAKEPEPGDYPEDVSSWMFEKIDAFNTTQEESMENLSLEERMRRKK